MKKTGIALLCILFAALLCFCSFADGNNFKDVESGSWYYNGVSYCVENGIMSGTSSTTFSPKTNLTRAMVVRMLASIDGVDLTRYKTNKTFTDVKQDSWYHTSVEWAYENGVVSGVGNSRFSPNSAVTREQLTLMLQKYAAYIGRDVSARYSNLENSYKDTAKISSWAKNAVSWAVASGIISGNNGNLNPKGYASRAEAAVMFCKFHQNFCSKSASGVTLSNTFGDNMVIQRDRELSVWGWADENQEGTEVIVTFKGEKATAYVENDGSWKATFEKTFSADSNGSSLFVKAKNVNIEIKNILVGDVYYVIGQSNVHWSMRGLENDLKTNHLESWIDDISYDDETASNIRLIRSSMMYYVGNLNIPNEMASGTDYVFDELFSERTKWRKTTEIVVPSDPSEATENIMAAEDFSAIGYLYAYQLQKETGVPVGMIEIDASGCPITSFAPNELCEKWGSDILDTSHTWSSYDRYCMKLGSVENDNLQIYPTMPSRFAYNQMLHPFMNFNISGIIWYQGESDMLNTKSNYGTQTEWTFSTELADLMTYFRQNMGSGNNDFPVYFIEYPSCYDDSRSGAYLYTGNVRSELGTVPMILENSYVVPSSDLWEYRLWSNNIHPFCKPLQAKRLVSMVLSNEYEIGDSEYKCGPTLDKVEYEDEYTVVLTFKYVGDGLMAFCEDESGDIYGLQVLTSTEDFTDGSWENVTTEAQIIGTNRIKITYSKPIYGVRYDAITDAFWPSQVNLCSSKPGTYGTTYCVPCVAFADYKLAK